VRENPTNPLSPVSVIIPAHDCAGTISRTLASLAPDRDLIREILLVDDASDDDTAKVAAAAAGEYGLPFRLTRTAVRNAGSARNIGLSQCDGAFIYFLDADDEAATDGLRHLVEALQRHPGKALAIGAAIRRTDGRPDKQKTPVGYGGDRARNAHDLLANKLWPIAMGSALCTRDVALSARFPENLRLDEDTCYWAAILLQADVVAIDEPVLLYNLDEAKMTGRFVEMPRSELTRIALALNRLARLGIDRDVLQWRKAWIATRMARALLRTGRYPLARRMLRLALAHPDFSRDAKVLRYRALIRAGLLADRLRQHRGRQA
jgi:glycosyltransferase involved in cell wall biosynthesis